MTHAEPSSVTPATRKEEGFQTSLSASADHPAASDGEAFAARFSPEVASYFRPVSEGRLGRMISALRGRRAAL